MSETQKAEVPATEEKKEKKVKHTLLKAVCLAFGVETKRDLLAFVKGGATTEETNLRNKVEQIKEFMQLGLIEESKGNVAVKAFEDKILALMLASNERKASFASTAGKAVEQFLLSEEEDSE